MRATAAANHAAVRGVTSRPRKVHHRLLKGIERPLNKYLLLLEMDEQVVPQGLLREHFGVTQHDEAVPLAK